MKKILVLIFSAFTFFTLYAQTTPVDLDAVFKGKYRMDSYIYSSWRPGTDQFSYVKSSGRDTIFIYSANDKKVNSLLTNAEIKTLFPDENVTLIPRFEWLDKNTLYFHSIKGILTNQKGTWKAEVLPLEGLKIAEYDAKNRLFIAKEENEQVFVCSEKNNYEKILLCSDTGKHIVIGEAVHRNEWGINQGLFISPNAQFVAFYRMDESMVEDYPLVNTTTSIAKVDPIKYPMSGRTNHEVTVGIFDVVQSVAQNKSVYHYLKTDKEKDGEFLTNITFSPDGKNIYIIHLNRAQNHAKVVEYDVKTGEKTRIILEETDNRYVEPQTGLIFLKNDRFIIESEKDGWNHCYLYELSTGKLIKQITTGNWDVLNVIGIDEKEENMYVMTNKDMPVDRYVYQINLKTGKQTNLTPEPGTHSVLFSSNYQYFIDNLTNTQIPLTTSLRNTKNKVSTLLFSAENPYKVHTPTETSIFSIKNNNGDDLYCRMIVSSDLDKTKKHPVFVYVYGGPHSQLVTNTFMSGGVFLHYMAQKGYVVFTLDNRGTNNRGAEFEKCIHRQMGVLEVQDQMAGIEYLKTLPFVDPSRIGVDGWSYGGFMTLSLTTTHSDVFASATCGGPVVDWKWYEIMYGERYMDTPQENPEGYEKTSILPKIKNLKSDLLVIHGALDNTVVWQHTLELLRRAISDKIELDYFVYPTHEHNVSGIDRVHLWKKIEKFHETRLK